MRFPTSINAAEAIVEPFWDNRLSRLDEWTVEPGDEHGLRVYEHWGWLAFEWMRKPPAGPALRMWRDLEADCHDYDLLVVSLMAPEDTELRVSATTDRGEVSFLSPPAPSTKKEWAVPLDGATEIRRITLEITAADDRAVSGWFNWIGLQNSAVLPKHLARWRRFDSAWRRHLRADDGESPSLESPGLILTADELARIRARHDAFVERNGTSPILAAADEAAEAAPEELIGEHVNFWDDTRFCRERDHERILLTHGGNLAFAGALTRDPQMSRLAARYAMSLGACGRWDDGPVGSFPGSTFELRGFVHSLCMYDVSITLDLAGGHFTDLGRDYLLRRIAEEGQGMVNYASWRHEYMHHCNQIAWISPGRLYGYLMVEQEMPRARPYTELAVRDLLANVEESILPDGGYVEGPTYFFWVARCAALALHLYGRARGRSLVTDLVPDAFARSAAFGAAIASTDDELDMIPICDAQKDLVRAQDGLAMLAARWPDSQWTSLYRKTVARGGGFPHSPLACVLDEKIPEEGSPPPALTVLPDTGLLASVRQLGEHIVKVLVLGNQAGASHTHEDKGSFVLEFAGETFAMDPGSCDYSNPLSLELKHAQRHCMLVPAEGGQRPRPTNPIAVDITPRGTGDAIGFSATVDATPGWEKHYRRWVRTWSSPSPDVLTIRDDYELAHGGAVEFLWQTKRDVRVEGQRIVLTGQRGTVVITAPEDTTIDVDELPLYGGAVQRRIAICQDRSIGNLTVAARLYPST